MQKDSHTGTKNFTSETLALLVAPWRTTEGVVQILLGKGWTPDQIVDLLTVDDE